MIARFVNVLSMTALVIELGQGAIGGLGGLRLDSLQPDCRLSYSRLAEAVEAVVRCQGRPDVPLAAPDSLRGMVRIETPTQALEYVRLFTTERRWVYLGMRWFAEPRVAPKPFAEGFLVTQRQFRACCVEPKVEASAIPAGDYRITRTLVDPQYRVFRVVEEVSREGRYAISSKELLEVDGRRLGRWSDGAFPELGHSKD